MADPKTFTRCTCPNTGESASISALSVGGMGRDRIMPATALSKRSASSLKSVSVQVRVDPGTGRKGANLIYFEVQAQNHEDHRARTQPHSDAMKAPMQSIKPWYRHPWPWILVPRWPGNGCRREPLYRLARGAQQRRTCRRRLPTRQGLAVNQRMARDHAGCRARLTAELVVGANAERICGCSFPRVMLPFAGCLQFRVIHPTRLGADQMVVLKRDAQGFYVGRLGSPLRTGAGMCRWKTRPSNGG